MALLEVDMVDWNDYSVSRPAIINTTEISDARPFLSHDKGELPGVMLVYFKNGRSGLYAVTPSELL